MNKCSPNFAAMIKYCFIIASIGIMGGAFVYGTGKFGDITIDYGRELYIPWQIYKGKILYKEIANYFGPLSSFINFEVFNIFGVSIQSLQRFKFILLALTSFVLYTLFGFITNEAVSAICIFIFVIFAGINVQEDMRNFNFISPYSHELMHGIIISMLIFYVLSRNNPTRLVRNSFVVGLMLGCIFIIKSEVFFAAAAALIYYIVATIRTKEFSERIYSIIALLFVGLAMPFVFALACFASVSSIQEAIGWLTLMYSLPFHLPAPMAVFYSKISGSSQPLLSMSAMLSSFGSICLLYYVFLKLSDKLTSTNKLIRLACILTACTIFISGYAVIFSKFNNISRITISFIPLLLALSFFHVDRCISGQENQAMQYKLLIFNSYIVFSLGMMVKVILRPGAMYYSAFLVFPGLLSFIMISLWYAPCFLFKKNIEYFIAPTLLLLTLILFPGVNEDIKVFSGPAFVALNTDKQDLFYSNDSKKAVLKNLINYINEVKMRNQTLAVMPEGIGINYLLRMDNPTRFICLSPPEWFTFGGDKITEEYISNSPDWIVLLHRDTPEYGIDYFGKGYAQDLYNWVDANYSRVKCFGGVPFASDNAFGACLYQKNK